MNELVFKGNSGRPLTNSLLVAQKFGKQHKHVLASIRELMTTAENPAILRMYVESTYYNDQNKEQPMYIMDRDGFVLLAMGFNGKDAMKLKMDYITEFNAMETRLKEAPTPVSTLDILKLAIKGIEEQHIELQEVKRDVEALKAHTSTENQYFAVMGFARLNKIPIGEDVAKSIGMRASRICKERGILLDSTHHPRYGRINTYPEFILREIFREMRLVA